MKQLSSPIGSTIDTGDVKLKVVLSTKGCTGCAFEKEEGAKYCEYSKFCFLHFRKDKVSVKYIKD